MLTRRRRNIVKQVGQKKVSVSFKLKLEKFP